MTRLRLAGSPAAPAWCRRDELADDGAHLFDSERPRADTWCVLSRDNGLHRVRWRRLPPGPRRRNARYRADRATRPALQWRGLTVAALAHARYVVTRFPDAGCDRDRRAHDSARKPGRPFSGRRGERVRPPQPLLFFDRLVRGWQAQCHTQFFLSLDNQFGALKLVTQAGIVAIELLDLSRRGVRFWTSLFRGECPQLSLSHLLAPAREH